MKNSAISTCLLVTCSVVALISLSEGKSLQSSGSYCPPEKTECPFGCCPYANGTCCTNGFHCCRDDEVCGSETGECLEMDQIGKISTRRASPLYFPGTPSGSRTSCPPCTTQCGEDKCCFFRDGTCCVDGVHCCPYRYACDMNRQNCYMTAHNEVSNLLQGGNGTSPVVSLSRALVKDPYVECPGGVRCPSYANCCEEPDYGFLTCCYLLGEAKSTFHPLTFERDICAE